MLNVILSALIFVSLKACPTFMNARALFLPHPLINSQLYQRNDRTRNGQGSIETERERIPRADDIERLRNLPTLL